MNNKYHLLNSGDYARKNSEPQNVPKLENTSISRRRFLQSAAAFTGGTALAAGVNLTASAEQMSHSASMALLAATPAVSPRAAPAPLRSPRRRPSCERTSPRSP